jgi:ComF family protein
MKIFKDLLFYLSVPKCAACGERLDKDDRALCKDCRVEYKNAIARSCSVCTKPLYECTCTTSHLDAHYIHKHIKVFRYHPEAELPTNKLIYSLKRDNREDVLDFLADELASSIVTAFKDCHTFVFTSIPRRRASRVKYGIDHAELLSARVAKKLGAKYEKTLISHSKKEQKLSRHREDRMKNARFDYAGRSVDLTGKTVVLIDDVVTTGASMSVAATLLKGAGARKIIGASLAIAYNDNALKI